MTKSHLVSFDTDRIKEYVFATEKLREIRGASRLLDSLNDEGEMQRFMASVGSNYESIFWGGGSGAVLAPSKEAAERLIEEVETLYRTGTVTASISGACIPINVESDNFGEKMKAAGFRLRRAKDEKAARILPGGEAFTQPCASCQRYPAMTVDADDNAALCASCARKREKEKSRKREGEQSRSFDDLNELGERSRPSGYIGFIQCDGNNTGDLLTSLPKSDSYKALAKGLRTLIEESTLNLSPESHEVLLAGGDDLILVTTADIALKVAIGIAQHIENQSAVLLDRVGLNGSKCTVAVSVVLAHATFPIAAFRSLADQLLKNAKRKCAEEGYRTSVIDFMVVTSAGSSDIATMRDEVLTEKSFVFPHGERKIRLTKRPYTLSQMERLINYARRCKDIPQSQLQFLYEGLFHSQAEAIYRWGKVAGRVSKENRKVMDEFYTDFGDSVGGLPPWQSNRDEVPEGVDAVTALGDLIEIYRFV